MYAAWFKVCVLLYIQLGDCSGNVYDVYWKVHEVCDILDVYVDKIG